MTAKPDHVKHVRELPSEELERLIWDHEDTVDLTLEPSALVELGELLRAAKEELANRNLAGGWESPIPFFRGGV